MFVNTNDVSRSGVQNFNIDQTNNLVAKKMLHDRSDLDWPVGLHWLTPSLPCPRARFFQVRHKTLTEVPSS
jgi:hypothetical protein